MKLISTGNFELQFVHSINGYDLVITTKSNNSRQFDPDRAISVSVSFSNHRITGDNAKVLLKLLGVNK